MQGIFNNKNSVLNHNRPARAVLFDCDGVIANSEEIMFAAGYEYITAHGLPYSRSEFAALSIGGTGPQSYLSLLMDEYMRTHNRPPPPYFAIEYSHTVYTALQERLEAVPGVGDLLERLKKEGVPCAVGTNAGTRPTNHKLELLGLSQYFNGHVYSWDPQTRPKPQPDIYLKAASALGYDARDCIVIDDSPAGVKAGVAAEATVIGFTGGNHREDEYARELHDVGAAYTARTMEQIGDIILRTLRAAAPGPR